MSANAHQVGGTHYKADGLQHWDLVWRARMGYFPAQITRYICRHIKKNGEEDVRKALHYAVKYTELLRKDAAVYGNMGSEHLLIEFFLSNPHLGNCEMFIIRKLVEPHHVKGLMDVRQAITDLLDIYRPS